MAPEKRQLIAEIKALAARAMDSNEPEMSQMLLVVSGSILSGASSVLLDMMMSFAKADLERMKREIKEANN